MCTKDRIGRTVRLTLLALALVIALGGTVWADNSSSLIGKKVRLSVPSLSAKPISGRLIRIEGDSVFLKVFQHERYEERGIPTAAIEGCDVRIKGRPLVPEGLCVGVLVGTAYSQYDRKHGKRLDTPFLATGLGGAIGATLGLLIRPGKWTVRPVTELHLPSAASTAFSPGLTVTLRF